MPTAAPLPAERQFGKISTAAEMLDVTERTIRNMIARGELTGYRLGSRAIRVDLTELQQVLTRIPTVGTIGGDAR
jgi:excisionase family DNA binding protein